MQYSKYNHLIEFDGKKVLYNSNSNALIEIDDDFLAKIKNQDFNDKELKLLEGKKIFVVNDDFELNRIKFETHAARANKNKKPI